MNLTKPVNWLEFYKSHTPMEPPMSVWRQRYEAHVSQWPVTYAIYKALPGWMKDDFAYGMYKENT